jgi:hypothetical protein
MKIVNYYISDIRELATLVPDFDLDFFLTVDEVNEIAWPPKKTRKRFIVYINGK